VRVAGWEREGGHTTVRAGGRRKGGYHCEGRTQGRGGGREDTTVRGAEDGMARARTALAFIASLSCWATLFSDSSSTSKPAPSTPLWPATSGFEERVGDVVGGGERVTAIEAAPKPAAVRPCLSLSGCQPNQATRSTCLGRPCGWPPAPARARRLARPRARRRAPTASFAPPPSAARSRRAARRSSSPPRRAGSAAPPRAPRPVWRRRARRRATPAAPPQTKQMPCGTPHTQGGRQTGEATGTGRRARAVRSGVRGERVSE